MHGFFNQILRINLITKTYLFSPFLGLKESCFTMAILKGSSLALVVGQ